MLTIVPTPPARVVLAAQAHRHTVTWVRTQTVRLAAVVLTSVAAFATAGFWAASSSVSPRPVTAPPSTLHPVSSTAACGQDVECIVERLLLVAVDDGPAVALERYRALARTNPYLEMGCHDHFERIGRAVAMEHGLGEFRDDGCQFGYLHGVLYAVGETYTDLDELLADSVAYCSGYERDPGVNDPFGACLHGVGHALAEITVNDPLQALQACRDLPEPGPPTCADGVLMEYGDGHLRSVGYLAGGSGENRTGITDVSTMGQLCGSAPEFARSVCFGRLWKFSVTGPDPSIGSANRICVPAVQPKDAQACHEGFGELVAQLSIRTESWPPASPAAADRVARRVAQDCALLALTDACLLGAIRSQASHLLAVDTPESLVPDPCRFTDPVHQDSCERAREVARGINWDKTSQTSTSTPAAPNPVRP